MATDIEVNEHDEDLEETEAEETETDSEGTDEEWTPPSKEEYDRVLARLNKVNAESKKHRLAAKAAKEAAEGAGGDDEALTAARKEVEEKYRPMVLKSAVREGLKDAGLIGDPSRLLKLIDYSSIDIDDDGDVNADDLDEVITGLKGDYPELFKKNRPGSVDTGRPATGREPKELTPSERQARQALRK